MISSVLALSLATLSLSGSALAASPSALKISVYPVAKSVASVEQLKISAVVSNPTNEDIKVLKYGSILDTLPTRSFAITKDGKDVDFVGIRVNVDIAHPDAYVTIPAGQSIAVNHTLSALEFDFEKAGTGTFAFTPLTRFQGSTDAPAAVAKVAPINIDVTSNVKKVAKVDKRLSTPVCDDAGRRQYIADSLTEARAAAGGAASNILQTQNSLSSQYRTYFGNNAWNTPWYNLDRIAGDLSSSGTRSLYCVDRNNYCAPHPGVVAYTSLATSNGQIVSSDITFCNSFFSFQATNAICSGAAFSSTRGNVVVHELSHAVAGTLDTVYGCDGARALGDGQKLTNADNYSCYALQIKRDYAC